MAGVGPTHPRSPSIWNSPSRSKSNSRTSQSDVDQSAQSLQDAVAHNQQAIQQAQQDADSNLEHIRQSYDQASMAESNNDEDALSKQRLKGYEELRALKQRQQAELNRVRREGERDLKNTQDYYQNTLYSQSRKGEEDLRSMKAKQGHELQYVQSSGQGDIALQKQDESRKLEALKQNQEERFNQLSSSARKEYERMRNNTELAEENQRQTFSGNYKAILDTDQNTIDRLRTEANEQIREIRQDTAQKLSAYGSRQSDPFYKMVDLNARLSDEGDHYQLEATIPAYEQKHVSVSLRGNTLVLSGTRRNEEKLHLGNGETKGTSSYQSFQETFPLGFPVDRNGLRKEFRGDQVIVTIPKSTRNEYGEIYQPKSKPARLRAERPHFPGELPGASDVSGESVASDVKIDKKSGRTLT